MNVDKLYAKLKVDSCLWPVIEQKQLFSKAFEATVCCVVWWNNMVPKIYSFWPEAISTALQTWNGRIGWNCLMFSFCMTFRERSFQLVNVSNSRRRVIRNRFRRVSECCTLPGVLLPDLHFACLSNINFLMVLIDLFIWHRPSLKYTGLFDDPTETPPPYLPSILPWGRLAIIKRGKIARRRLTLPARSGLKYECFVF